MQEALVGGMVDRLAGARLMPSVDLGLHLVATPKQGRVLRFEIRIDGRQSGPEGGRLDAGPRQRALLDKADQRLGDLQTAFAIICVMAPSSLGREAGCGDAGQRAELVVV